MMAAIAQLFTDAYQQAIDLTVWSWQWTESHPVLHDWMPILLLLCAFVFAQACYRVVDYARSIWK